MKEDFNLDKLLQEKLEGFSTPPPPRVWKGIKGGVAAAKRKKRILYVRWISAAAMLVLALMAGWYFIQPKNDIAPKMVESSKVYQENNQTEEQTNQIINESDINSESKNQGENQADHLIAEQKIRVYEKSDINQTENEAQIQHVGNMVPYAARKERFSLALLNKIEALFEEERKENNLAEGRYAKSRSYLSENEKIRIAENVKSYEEIKDKESAWKLGMHLTPGYSSHQASHNDIYARNMTYSGQEGTGNMGGGFSVQYKTNKKFSIESGIYYAQNGQKSRNSELFAFNSSAEYALQSSEKSYFNTAVNVSDGKLEMNSTAGVIEFSGVPDRAIIAGDLDGANSRYDGTFAPTADAEFSNTLLTSGEFSQVFDFIEIPLYLRYYLLDSKFDIEILGGLNAGIVVGNNAFMDDGVGAQNIGRTQDISPVNLSGTLGIGLTYGLGKHLSMAVEPRFNYYINSINTNPDVDFRPYRIGVYTGVYYEF